MSRIRFLSDQVFDTGAPGKGPAFAKGSTLRAEEVAQALGQRVTEAYAEGFLERWLRRGVAVRIGDDEPDAVAEPERAAVDYDRLTRAELDALAADRGLDVSGARNKGDVIAALTRADDAANERGTALLKLAVDNNVEIPDGSTEEQILAALAAAGVGIPQA